MDTNTFWGLVNFILNCEANLNFYFMSFHQLARTPSPIHTFKSKCHFLTCYETQISQCAIDTVRKLK